MARSRVPSEERVFSLVLALVASAQGLTKRELLSSVYGYADRYADAAQRVALERQFERDKEQLRELGIPVDAIDAPGEPGNNQLTRYRISRDALEVPRGLSFSDRELMMLRMAALAWREGSLTDEARRAAMKLEALGAGIDAPSLGVSAGFGASEPAAPALLAAIERGEVAEFDYEVPERGGPLARRVLPLRLHRFEGRWHLVAFDLDRGAPRVFLLSRIASAVSRRATADAGARIPESLAGLAERAIVELEERQRTQVATLRVRRGSMAEAQLAERAIHRESISDEFAELRVGTADLREFAALVAGYGPDAEALAPGGLRDAVVATLRAVAVAHRGAAPQAERGGGHG